jgi:hypothetical protein
MDTPIFVPESEEPVAFVDDGTNDEQAAVKLAALSLVVRARELEVVDQTSLTEATERLLHIKDIRRRLDAEFDPGIQRAHALHKALVAQKKKWTGTLDEAEAELRPKVAHYLEVEDRRRLEAEREAQLAKERAAREAENSVDKAHQMLQDGLLDEAAAVRSGVADKAASAISAAEAAIPPKPVAPGTYLRDEWNFEIENEELIPRAFLIPNEKRIRNFIAAMKEQAVIPGVRIFRKKNISVRTPK